MKLRATDVTVRLGPREVLSGISVACEPGRVTGLIGPNGAGKSTLLRALARLLPVANGEISLDGTPLAAVPRAELGRRIAYLPQGRSVHWPLSVRHVVGLGRLPHTASKPAEDEQAVTRAMHEMDVAALAGRPVAELSGGELARVLVARALAQEAPIVLADEPTAGLDPAHALGLFKVLQDLAARGRTIVVALHDLTLAARFCDDIVMLDRGRLVAAGPAAQILTQDRLGSVFGVSMALGMVGGVPAVVPVAPIGLGERSGEGRI